MMTRRSIAVALLCFAMLWATAANAVAAGGSVIGPAQVEGIRTTRDRRGVVLVFVGGRAYSATDPCSVRYIASVRETKREVNVVVTGESPPGSAAGVVCTMEGYSRTLTVRLRAPLGHRLLTGSATPEHGVFNGALLARATWLPTAWHAAGEAGTGAAGSWTRTWFPKAQPPADGHCTPAETGLGLTQGPPRSVLPFVGKDLAVANQQVAGTYKVHGEYATYYLDPERSAALVWTEGRQAFALSTISPCGGDTLTRLDSMLRFARGLEIAHPGR
jgi:hypothetical protein